MDEQYDPQSGTNKLHGAVWEFARRTWLDANSWQNNYQGLPRTSHRKDQCGFELGGLIFLPNVYDGRNKMFSVLSYEGLAETLPATQVESVPDPN